MVPYLCIQLFMVYSQLSIAAVVDISQDGAQRRSFEEASDSAIRKLQDKLQEMEDWSMLISNELKVLRDAYLTITNEQEDRHHRTRRQLPAQLPGCTPGTFGCPIQVTPYSAASGSCILCPAGTSGPPGPAGPPGRDGRDAITVVTTSGETHTPCYSQGTPNTGNLSNTSGAVYIRWGHHGCPSTSELVYTGTAASSIYRISGGGADQLCLPGNPVYDSPISGVGSSRAFLYSLEYETYELVEKHWHDVPCAVCKATSRFSKLMIPGTNQCPSSDWTFEYGGYLMAERTHATHHKSLHICVDREMQVVPRTSERAGGSNEAFINFVEARCFTSGGGIPCGPYVDGYEITCAVCTQ